MAITPQQARQELARRELENRSLGVDEQSVEPSFIDNIKKAFVDTGKSIVNPPYRIAARTLQGIEQTHPLPATLKSLGIIKRKEALTYKNPLTGDVVVPYGEQTKITEPIGLGLQGGALVAGNPALGGALFGGGQAMEVGQSGGDIAKNAIVGAAIGGTVGKALSVASGKPVLTGKTGQIIESGIKNTVNLPKPIFRAIKKYQTLRKGSQFEGIRQDLTPMERVDNLKNQAKLKYGEPLKQEQEQLSQTLKQISDKEKVVLGKSKSAIDQSKLKLKENLDTLAEKMKQETEVLKKNIDVSAQKSAIEGKTRLPILSKENSSAYGNKLDDIINVAEQEGNLPTKQTLQGIFDKTDDEIASTFIDTGAPLTKYNALKDKYLGGFSSEANPEAQAISKALGFKKGQMKNSGIDWSRVDVSQSQFKMPNPNEPINIKGLLQDVRSVSKAISAKAKGAERAFTDEDLVSVIFQKNIGEHMASTYPEFAKLQKSYAPLIEQMKAGRKVFKPGTPYDLGTAPSVLKKPDIAEQGLISNLESGTEGFNKGMGPISQPVKKAQQKLSGTEKGYEIAKSRIEKLNANEQRELGELLNIREEAYKLAKEKVTVKSMVRQKQIKDQLEKRMQDLEKGSFRGKETISKLTARSQITSREKKIATGGGIATMADYLIRRIVAKGILK